MSVTFMLRHVATDLHQGWRLLGRQPGLALAAVTALAMGIGFTTTMFGIVHGGTRPLPFDDPHELVAIRETDRGRDTAVRPFTFQRWQASLTSFEGLGAWRSASVNVSGGGTPDRVPAAAITPNAFGILGAAATRGRALVDADAAAGAPKVAVIGDDLWRTRFGADPDTLARREGA